MDLEDCVIAIDIGASSGRVIACFLRDGVLHSKEVYRFKNGFVEDGENFVWDIEQIYAHMCMGLRKAVGLFSVRGVGVDTWGVDYVLVNEAGELMDKAFAYRDTRTDAVYESVVSDLGREALYEFTGIQFMSINTLYQLAAHVRQNRSVFSRARYLLMVPDYLHYRLCGVFCNEFTEASTSQMLNYREKAFDVHLLEYLQLSSSLFPPMVEAGHVLGFVNDETRRQTGLEEGVRIIAPGSHDTASAVVSCLGDEKTAFISSGTWSIMGAQSPRPVVSEKALKYNFSNEGGVYDSTMLLKNIMGMWIINRVKVEVAPDMSFEHMLACTQKAEAFQTIINPNAKEFLNPTSMAEAIQVYARNTKQRVPQDIAQFARCIYESLALEYRKTLRGLEDVTSTHYTSINIIGGGSRNGFLNQCSADLTQRRVIAGPVETSSIGNAAVQMISLGWIENLGHARKIIARSEDVAYYEPQAELPEETIEFFNGLHVHG